MVEEMKGGCIRVQSSMNEWMDCIFLVSKEEKEKAIEVLKKAWDSFWEDDVDACYGEYLEAALRGAGIAFDSYYAEDKQSEEYESLTSGMIKILHRAVELGWCWRSWVEEGQRIRTYIEMEKHSPAGEDFIMVIDYDAENQAESFLKGLWDYADNFDIDSHVEMWLPERGKNGCPATARELVEDAEAIVEMIKELYGQLENVLHQEGGESENE